MIGWMILADVLFIGTGLFGPDLPQMIEAAGKMRGAESRVEVREAPDGPLDYHWLNAAAGPGVDPRAVLAGGQVDQLVMTEKMPLTHSLLNHDSVEYGRRFRDLALRGNPSAESFLYETWPALDAGSREDWRKAVQAGWPIWQALVGAINSQSHAGSEGPPMQLIPLAQGLLALEGAIADGKVPGLEDLTQLFDDGRMLNDRGTYFAAMVIYAAISGDDPEGLPVWLGRNRPATLDEAVTAPMAEAMQKVARGLVRRGDMVSGTNPALLRRAQMQVNATVGQDNGFAVLQDPAASYLDGISRPGVAFNLSAVNDWSVEQPFLDVFKTARPWIGHLPGQWGGFDYPELLAAGYLDDQGWPKRMPPEVTHLSTVILTGLDARMISAAGRYVLRYKGKGSIELQGRAQNVDYQQGVIAFDFIPGEGTVHIVLRAIDATDPVREISVIRQDRLALADAGQIFNPDFLARLRGSELLRFMGWMRTNNAVLVGPEDIPRIDDYVWSTDRGVPPEVMVALANELDLDPWFTLPHQANDDLARSYARRVRDTLEPGRRAWVEFSNEIWNGSFDQREWADAKALSAWGAEGAGVQYGAWRAAQVADIWAEEFAPSASGRLVRVVATFTGWPGAEVEMLEAPAWKAADPDAWEPLAPHFDAYAITGYFYANLDDADRMEMLRLSLDESRAAAGRRASEQGLSGPAREAFIRDHRFDLAIDRALVDLRSGALSGDPTGSVEWLIDTIFSHHRRAAAKYRLDLAMYEGGSHVVALPRYQDDEELTAFLTQLNYAPGMGDLYRLLMRGWRRVSDQPFNFYTAIESPSGYGSWGVLRYLDDDNPRWDAVSELDR